MIPLIVFGMLLLAGCIYAILAEKKDWNNGRCPCGKGDWRSCDMDSQGGVLYRCSDSTCDSTIWLSWLPIWDEDVIV